MLSGRASAMTVLTSVMFFNDQKRLVNLAARNRLPKVYPWREPVDAGGFLSYGPNLNDLYRRAAYFVDKILKGANPPTCPSSSRRSSSW
jgi:putative tryptophan/tyrosine transport system substrate-binding protein